MNGLAQDKGKFQRKRPAAPPSNQVDEDALRSIAPNNVRHRPLAHSSNSNGNLPLIMASIASVLIISATYYITVSNQKAKPLSVEETPAVSVTLSEPTLPVAQQQNTVIASHIIDAVALLELVPVVAEQQQEDGKRSTEAWVASPLSGPKWEPSPLTRFD